MTRDNPKPSPKPGAAGAGKAAAPESKGDAKPKGDAKSTGRVQFDDRGNAIWEWSIATGAFGREVSTQRLQKLEHPALSLAEDAPSPFDQVRSNPLGTKTGYNPYDSGKLGKPPTPAKKDLRKLGDWLRLKKQAGSNKDDEE
ncbi:MAG TPA: hypothetical protein VKG63_10690 [Steroidobacteraceae bacterium]|nr:hypothetical protein [Steroidobacteraceae bacterium]